MKHPCIRILLVLCLSISAGIAAPEPFSSSVAGVITGPDGSRLPGAIITVKQPGSEEARKVVSSSTGLYLVPQLPAGRYELTAELAGFQTLSLANLEIAPGISRTLDLSMGLATIREMVNVIGPLRRDSIEATENRESLARDVGEVMSHAPGVWNLRKGGIAGDIVLRGLASKDLNVLVDGQRIYGACPNHMDPSSFHVDFAEVDRIEIGKGPFDMKNQGSLGGVVNIVTRKPEPGFHAFANFSAGSYDYLNPSATMSYGRTNLSVLAGYSYRVSSPYTDGSGRRFTESLNFRPEARDSDAFRIGTVWVKGSLSPFRGHLAQISYARQEADHVLYPYLQMDAAYDDTDRINAGYQINDLSGFVRSVRLQAYYTKVSHWMTDQYRTSSISFLRPYSMGTMAGTEALGGKFETMLRNVTVGIEAYHREWNAVTQMAGSSYAPQHSIPNVRTDAVGIYSEYSRSLNDRLKLSFGGRIDSVTTAADSARANTNLYFAYNSSRLTSNTRNFPSGHVRLGYQMPFGIDLSGGIGHTVRVPDARERYFALKRMGTDWVGNPELNPSRNTGLDVGLAFRRQGFLMESSFYMNWIDDFIAVVPQTKVNPVMGIMNSNARSYQNADARMYGGEFLVSYLLTRQIYLSSDLSYVRGTRGINPSRGIRMRDLPEMPPMRSRTTLRYDTGRLFAEIEGVYAGAQRNVDTSLGERATPGYGIANIKTGIAYKNFSLKLGLNNLFGRRYFEHLSYQRDPFRSGATIYEPGRNFLVHLSFRR